MLFYSFGTGDYVITGNDSIAVLTSENKKEYLGTSMQSYIPLSRKYLKKLSKSSDPEAKLLKCFNSISEFRNMDTDEFKKCYAELFL